MSTPPPRHSTATAGEVEASPAAVRRQRGQAAGEGAAPVVVPNAHQRKLAVMRRLDALAPDKFHPHHRFSYISIQALSAAVRRACVEEGLDVVFSVTDGAVVIELVNADAPSDRIVTTWPTVDGDRGWAYGIKFPLMRLFLVGDDDEADEAEMAAASGRAATRAASSSPVGASVPSSVPPARTTGGRPTAGNRPITERTDRSCPECGTGCLEVVTWPGKEPQLRCSDWRECRFRAPIDQLREAVPAAAGDAQRDFGELLPPIEAYEPQA